MTKPVTVLRQPESQPEGRLPAHVKRLPRPQPLGRAVELAFLRWEKRQLAPTARFWRDFGMHVVESGPQRLLARGTGHATCIAMATRGREDRFIGPAFGMSDDTDLQVYIKTLNAKQLSPDQIPGGGRGVELLDPVGRSVWLLQGQARAEPLPNRSSVTALSNSAVHAPRVNRTVRTPIEPAKVIRLGHVVLQTVDFAAMTAWYLRVLGLIPSDVQYLADGSPNLAFCRLNLGDTPADHHTLVIVGAIEEKYEHSAYEVIDLDALGQGYQVLRTQGYRHVWGIGRHLLGSQLFDYWRDPDGFELEHYTDGDLFTADAEAAYSPFDMGSLWAWGDDPPASMKPKMNLRTLLRIVRLLQTKRITVQRLKLISAALNAPARPWL
jgi:catechol 2,3-dioxygenase-like lactoylglutathione lyase family enzyme